MDENLGPAEAWTIKAVPREVRKQMVREAQDAGVSLGEYVTQRLLGNGQAPPPAPVVNLAALAAFTQAAVAALGSAGLSMPKAAARRAQRLLDDQVRAASGLAPRKVRQRPPPRITAPDSPARIESRGVPDPAPAK